MSFYSSRQYGGRGTPFRNFAAASLSSDRDIMEGLIATPLKTLKRPACSSGKAIEVQNLQYIGSYNWTGSSQPTIIVPGSPPEWRDRAFPYSVPRDSGAIFVDQNGARMPTASLLPLFRAADVVAEDLTDSPIDWSTVDFITDRNGLRKLLRWIHDSDESAKEFRIDMQLAGKHTVLFNRWEKRTKEDGVRQWPSYGISFERASTVPAKGCENATGHHRIVQYDFDGLKLIVRFEVDACIPTSRSSRTTTSTTANVDDLTNLLSGLNVASGGSGGESTKSSRATGTDLAIIRGGYQVPQSAIVEMTTRSQNRALDYDWVDAYPQLYLSQTPHHFLAVHNRGIFESITKRKLGSPEMKRIEDNAQAGFRNLRRALGTIQELVMDHGQRGRLSLVYRKGSLQVFERTSQDSCLPEDVMERFGV